MNGAYGLYGHIRSNRLRSGFLICALFPFVHFLILGLLLIFQPFLAEGQQNPGVISDNDAALAQGWENFLTILPWSIGVGLCLVFLTIRYWGQKPGGAAALFFLIQVTTLGTVVTIYQHGGPDQFFSVQGRVFLELLFDAWKQSIALLPFTALFALCWIYLGFRFHQSLIDNATDAKDLAREDDPRIFNLLENLCISRGITLPRLQIVESDALNAYASGVNDRQYRIALTRGMLTALDDQEIEAVLAHELTHIRNGDTRLMIVAILIAGIISFVGESIFRTIRLTGSVANTQNSDDRHGNRVSGPGMIAVLSGLLIISVSWFLSLIIRFALSRSREYLADAGAVELTKNPEALIRALRKIKGKAEMSKVPSGIMEMCFENEKNSFADLFSTHPSIQKRIEKILDIMGGKEIGAAA